MNFISALSRQDNPQRGRVMKIGVIGTFARDSIALKNGEQVDDIGGVFFTAAYLAVLLGKSAEIYPACFVGEDFYEEVARRLSNYKNIRLDGIIKVSRKNTRARLINAASGEREEFLFDLMPPLNIGQMEILRDADAIIINFITGCDVSLEAIKSLRNSSRGFFYLDVHSLVMRVAADGKKYFHRPDDWRDWLAVADAVQCNEMEARTLAGSAEELSEELLIEFGKSIIRIHPVICHITLADRGSRLIYRKNNRLRIKEFKAQSAPNIIDPVGCGDAFGAAFLAKYLSGGDEEAATRFAGKIAALNCAFSGSSGIASVKDCL